MSLLATVNASYTSNLPNSPVKLIGRSQGMDQRKVTLRSSASSNQTQSASVRRRNVNISHFNALQNAVSNLARIDDFDLEELGYGFFSDVFKVTHKQTGKVMVLKRNKNTNTKMNILREVQLMNRLSHPNILQFKGVCVHEGQLHALTEFINGGDLEQVVTSENIVLSWKQRIRIALDVAKGMKYLHSVGIFHRDLTAKNCLVRLTVDKKGKKKYSCIVADLGLAEKIPSSLDDEKQLAMVGTPYIMAPEVLHGKPYNEKADIFSFGLLICQLIALVSSDPEELPRSNDFGLARDLFHKMISIPLAPGEDPKTSLPPPSGLPQLAYDCCQLDPKARPSFNEIVLRLEALLGSLKSKKASRSSYRVGEETKEFNVSSKKEGSDTNIHGASERDSSLTQHPEHPSQLSKPTITGKRNSSTSSPRLSRSFSDISRELLNHAAHMVAASSTDNILDDGDSYSNPFAALEHITDGKMKLTDEPSIALLEMTFDLATFDSLKTSNKRNSRSKRKRRPKSTYFIEGHQQNDHGHLPLLTSPIRLSSGHECRAQGTCSVPHSPRMSTSEELLTQCHDCNYQRAVHRSMVLSPLGNKLATWWCTRQRNNHSGQSDRHSLAAIMSLMSKNIRDVRHSISLPDLSQIGSLFHPAEQHTDADITKSLNELILPARTIRSRTADEIFDLEAVEASIAEESEADLLKLKTGISSSVEHPKSESEANQISVATEEPETTTSHVCEEDPSNVVQLKSLRIGETDRNTSLENDYNTYEGVKSNHDGPMKDADSTHDATLLAGHSSSMSSSSSSECSTCGFLMSLQTGEVTQLKRRGAHCRMPASSQKSEQVNFSLNNNHPLSELPDGHIRSCSILRKSHNRDSGYEDAVLEDSQHPGLLSPSIDAIHHHLTWNIPEEPSIVSLTASPHSTSSHCASEVRTHSPQWSKNGSATQSEYT